jgi:hypothetical protein
VGDTKDDEREVDTLMLLSILRYRDRVKEAYDEGRVDTYHHEQVNAFAEIHAHDHDVQEGVEQCTLDDRRCDRLREAVSFCASNYDSQRTRRNFQEEPTFFIRILSATIRQVMTTMATALY